MIVAQEMSGTEKEKITNYVLKRNDELKNRQQLKH